MYYDYDNELNEIEIIITFGIGDNPNVVFLYCGDDPKVEEGTWEDEDGNEIEPTDEMIAYIRQQLWVQQITYSAEPQSVLVDGVFVTYTLEISKGVAMWQFYSISATDWDGGYYDEETLDLSTLSSDQMREIINKADKSFDKVVGYYPQWKDYNIDLVDSEICFS